MGRKIEAKKDNPAKAFLKWRSSEKCFRFWDKEQEKNQFIPLPFKFLWLREYTTINGYYKKQESGIWSNEVERNGVLKVMFHNKTTGKDEILLEGTYEEIKEKKDAYGAKFTKSIYGMTESGNIINLQLYGSGLGNWFDITGKAKSRIQDEWIEVVDVEEGKNGANTYYSPVFQFSGSLTDEESALADEAFKPLEEYLDGYFKPSKQDQIDASIDAQVPRDFEPSQPGEDIEPVSLSDDLPF